MSLMFESPLPEHVLVRRKELARKAALKRRRLAVNKAHEKRACRHLAEFLHYVSPLAVIALYYPIQTEISPLGALEDSRQCVTDFCLPVVTGANRPLEFRDWMRGDRLVKGAFGTKEPKAGKTVIPDILIVPLLAYDEFGVRLGYGGGYYDRTIERLRAAKRIKAVGFAYSAQREDRLPSSQKDQKMDMFVTEKGLVKAIDIEKFGAWSELI